MSSNKQFFVHHAAISIKYKAILLLQQKQLLKIVNLDTMEVIHY